ncbi:MULTISPECIES: hypothetical protein [unclassified Pseudomonas]|uniref:hypothetical protein n=1 Tax=unclassified Pseudomonas TaxID=196821 RepID=UPI001F58BF72|nr:MULTISPECIES: hypothetical protein [unclassified Pseudomonas]
MTENVFATPTANLQTAAQVTPEFYVIAERKLFILSVLSLGLYMYFWSFKHWSNYKKATQADIWPWARGLLCIFFVHKLYRRADHQIRITGRSYIFDFEQWATMLVVITVAGHIVDRLSDHIESTAAVAVWLFISIPLRAYLMQKGQAMLNFAAGDADGSSNARFNVWNYLIMVPGAALWALMLFLTLPSFF